MTIALSWFAALAVLLALDTVWLGFAARALYTDVLGPLMLDGFRLVPALVFYPLHIAGVCVFVVPKAAARPLPTAGYGAFYGLCVYGAYDLTNHAVLKVWTTQLTVVDMAWGALVTAAAASMAAWVQRRRAR